MKTAILSLLFGAFLGSTSHAADPLQGLPPEVVNLHKAMSGNLCDQDLFEKSQSFELTNETRLFLVPCSKGAYNFSYLAYTSTEGQASPVMVLAYNGEAKVVYPELFLTNASFEPKTKTLYTYAKGRGTGDCGQSSETRFLASGAIVTTVIRDKMRCDGKDSYWPIVFRQKIKK